MSIIDAVYLCLVHVLQWFKLPEICFGRLFEYQNLYDIIFDLRFALM